MKTKTNIYRCTDGCCDIDIRASSMDEAAHEYATGGGELGDPAKTAWADVRVTPMRRGKPVEDESRRITVTLQPAEPDCISGGVHDWECPFEVVGGIRENPGVWGHGAGTVSTEVCRHCGRYQITDTWAQRQDTGEQGLLSVTYRPADEASQAWVASLENVAEND